MASVNAIAWAPLILYLVELIIKIVALGTVPGNRRPSSSIAWLLPLGANVVARGKRTIAPPTGQPAADPLVIWPPKPGCHRDQGHRRGLADQDQVPLAT